MLVRVVWVCCIVVVVVCLVVLAEFRFECDMNFCGVSEWVWLVVVLVLV